MENDYKITTIPGGLTAGAYGGRMNINTCAKAHALDQTAQSHIDGYASTQSCGAQIWCCGIGRRAEQTLFIIVPRDDVIHAARSSAASMIWDDREANKKAGRNADADIPRVLAHGMATAVVGLRRAGLHPERYIAGVANVRYTDIPRGRNRTRSSALEKMCVDWIKSFDTVQCARWTGEMLGGGYDYQAGHGRIAKAHYNGDIAAEYIGGATFTVEVKGQFARMICPTSAHEQFGL